MATNDDELKAQARLILDAIAFTPFADCQPLDRNFNNLPSRPGIYAIRHESQGLLYIGKTKNLRSRFSGGHKAFLWAWLDQHIAQDVRIAVQPIPHWKNPRLLFGARSYHPSSNRTSLQRPDSQRILKPF